MDIGEIVIYLVVPRPKRHSGKTGGTVRLVEILKRFKRRGENFRLTIYASEREAEQLKNFDVSGDYRIVKSKLHFSGYLGLVVKSLFLIAKCFFVFGFPKLRSDRKNIVYSSSDLFWETIPAFLLKIKLKNIKWIQVIHHVYPHWKKRSGSKPVNFFGYYLQKISFFLIKRKADKIIVVSDLVKKDLQSSGFQENRIHVSSNAIDLEKIIAYKPDHQSYDGIFLGRLNHSKGIFDLIEIWKRVIQVKPGSNLAIVGGGDSGMVALLREKIAQAKIKDNVRVFGYLDDEKAFGLIKSSKIFLFPSHEEGWGIAIAEAMACRLPVVSWDLPVYSRAFEDNITQIKENDFQGFSDKVLLFLNDNELRTTQGEKSGEFIKKYSWDAVAKKEWEIINY